MNTEEALEELKVDSENGLNDSEVKKRMLQYGKNQFTPLKESSLFEEIIDSIKEPMMVILLIAAIVSAVIGEWQDAIGIVCAVIIGIAIGIITEGQSAKAAEALAKMTEDIVVKALRNGNILQLNKSDLVPGDIIIIETGDMIPADGRLVESVDLKIREDMLTGESEDVSKRDDILVLMETLKKGDKELVQDPIHAKQKNMVFGGTFVAYGKGKFVVTATGDNSEMGKIAQNLCKINIETPLQVKLGNLGGMISKISSVIALLLFIVMVVKMVLLKTINVDLSGFFPFLDSIAPIKTSFIVCIALIVAAVPEGLPTMINMTLAITMQKMAKINALVRKKEACETIGSVSVICSDKTGTLTQNRMTVEKVYLNNEFVQYKECKEHNYFVENCILNSTADIEKTEDGIKYLGNATECALLLYNEDHNYIEFRKSKKVIHQVPFSSERKRMATVVNSNEEYVVYSKGAPEIILELCSYELVHGKIIALTEASIREKLEEIEKLQKNASRIIAFAHRSIEAEVALTAEENYHILEKGLVFEGFVGIRDPLRTDVKAAIELAEVAGVETKMLTGDNINTAISIGKELGILKNNKIAVEASYIDVLSDEELQKEIKNIAIVARSKPDTKLRIVAALQANNEVVAVTGDGINDAPALNRADVGIAMGIAGTEVSKNAADILLTDDNFSTIVQGIKWGRGIYQNFQRFIQFQITVNFVAFLTAILSVLLGLTMPFTTIQLLWVNIIMDGPPALSLGLEPVRSESLQKKPVNRNASIITKTMLTSMILNAAYITIILLTQMKFNILGVDLNRVIISKGTNEIAGSEMGTVLFALFAFSALFNALNCREFGLDSIVKHFGDNKIALQIISITAVAQILVTQFLSGFFNSVPLSLNLWVKVIALAAMIIVINELVKFIGRIVLKKKVKDQDSLQEAA